MAQAKENKISDYLILSPLVVFFVIITVHCTQGIVVTINGIVLFISFFR